jgi:4-amino-4-deoxy-L-arabinose transferase-like glycosyltransferase
MIEFLQNPEIQNKFLFITACLCLLLSFAFFVRNSFKPALFFLILSAASLRIFMILLDPYLNFWDEQYHALVAKSLAKNPLLPVLIANPAIPLDPLVWTENNVWLHKQPLFLWQIAISLKLFGFNEIALRLPSLLMSLLMVPVIYRMGSLLMNRTTGYFAAMLFATAYYPLELMVGAVPTDHNDTSFIFYVTLSLWAFSEYLHTRKTFWLILIGISSGAAILVKWLVGLLVYSGWGLLILMQNRKNFHIRSFIPLFKSLVITIFIALPWQIYIFWKFPNEAAFEYAHAASHFFDTIEGHAGGLLYHFEIMTKIYGLHPIVILSAFIGFIFILKNNLYKIAFATFFLLLYSFYSLAETKMPAFGLIVCSIVFISIGALIDYAFTFIKIPFSRVFAGALVIFTAYFSFDFMNLQKMHSSYYGGNDYTNRPERIENTKIFKQLPSLVDADMVIFNCKHAQHIPARFYSGLEIYDVVPELADVKKLKKAGRRIAVFKDERLPVYLSNDSDVFVIPVELK